MPYTVNGKLYTDNPMMDEIVYNCKIILNGIVVKNEFVANYYETEETLRSSEYYFKCILGSITFDNFPFDVNMLMAYGYSYEDAQLIVNNRTYVPETERDNLVAFCTKYYIDNFVEKNKYYRALMGLPEYGENSFDIYITEKDLPAEYDISTVDFSLPLHKQSNNVISAMRGSGRLKQLIDEYRSFNYSY